MNKINDQSRILVHSELTKFRKSKKAFKKCVKENVNYVDNHGYTLLMHYASHGDLEMVKIIQEFDKTPDMVDNYGNTAYFHALCGLKFNICKIISQKPDHMNIWGETAAEFAKRLNEDDDSRKKLEDFLNPTKKDVK